ncbi:hypothetical protein [Methylovulum psychrotolerans]|uniref:Endonuclease III n=1 Tax=Methylovulum psychrotolerans TaxID=1704499 RepID=A0A1Z4BUK5_9GAMM|nr:hypothetical protein [Methylovulum psychrotolerans]ASF44987.1 hypothetical protein CEK71_02295 [Methylovulum psychrotolerans]
MRNLEQYKDYFNQAYPDYADSEYGKISTLVATLPTIEKVQSILDSDNAKAVLDLVVPLIKIKNYKSQIPFPVNFYDAVNLIAEIKSTEPSEDKLSKAHAKLFENFLSIKGFQLPTISAVLHFCHPSTYPIVDRNIEAACGLLSKEFPDDFCNIGTPRLPASTTSIKNKLSKYQGFILFLRRLKELHNEKHYTNYNFRELDKALMVYGVSDYKIAAENCNITAGISI